MAEHKQEINEHGWCEICGEFAHICKGKQMVMCLDCGKEIAVHTAQHEECGIAGVDGLEGDCHSVVTLWLECGHSITEG